VARTVTLYHNPRCSKSRQALSLLRELGVEPTVVEYLKDPPTKTAILRLLRILDGEPHDLLRRRETPYRTHGLGPGSTRAAIAEAIAADPILLERPLAVRGGRAVIGRPPERVLDLLDR
jgi:arsenate reductase